MDSWASELGNGAVRPKKAAEIVADKIRSSIIRGKLSSGDSLPTEAHLIARYEVSRPTLREAIRILESENLVQVSRGARGGAQIQPPSIGFLSTCVGHALQSQKTKLSDVYTARCILEPSAARLAAETRPREAAATLKAHVDREFTMVEDRHKVAIAVAEFHRLVVQESGNLTLALISSALNSISERHLAMVHQFKDAQESVAAQRERAETGFRSHRKLVRIIATGDGSAAEAHWTEHLRKARDYWLRGFGENGLDILGETEAPDPTSIGKM